MHYVPGTESIGRVDFALDFFAPVFVLVPDDFIMHARCNRVDHTEIEEISTNGHSGRSTSVTIGKNPGRQVIVYDKRAEAIPKRKPYWWPVWNATRAVAGQPPLDKNNRAESQVWRVELRAYQHQLKDGWHVTTWGDLLTMLPHSLELVTSDVRYTAAGVDSNRSRWPDHPLWLRVRKEIGTASDGLCSSADPLTVQQVIIAERAAMLEGQITGCMLTHAALLGATVESAATFMYAAAQRMIRDLEANSKRMTDRLQETKDRYRSMCS